MVHWKRQDATEVTRSGLDFDKWAFIQVKIHISLNQ
jgi:hypothetical protein